MRGLNHVQASDHSVESLEFPSSVVALITVSFFLSNNRNPRVTEIYGDLDLDLERGFVFERRGGRVLRRTKERPERESRRNATTVAPTCDSRDTEVRRSATAEIVRAVTRSGSP